MIKSIKQLKRELDARVDEAEIVRDEEGRAVIEMTVLRDDDFLSDFSAGTKPMISSEVAEYLTESALPIPPQSPVCVKIYSDCIDENEKEVYTNALHGYFERHYLENRISLKRNNSASLIMLIIGLVTLAIGLSVGFFELVPVLGEALDIFAWVFIWEAVDLFFLERKLLQIKQIRYLRFYECKIEYLPQEKSL